MIKGQSNKKKAIEFILMTGPSILILVGVTLIPFIYGIMISLQRARMGKFDDLNFVGLANYLRLFTREEFWSSLQVTLIFVVASTVLTISIGFLLATGLNRFFIGRTVYMALLILPMVMPPVVAGLMWKFMLDSHLGIFGYFTKLIGLPAIPWLSSSVMALFSVIIVDVWQWTPFCALLLLAGLQLIPKHLYEAGTIDSANRFQVFRYIVVPLMMPIFLIVLLIRLMDTFKIFDTIFVLTQGGPGMATEVFNMWGYHVGFRYFDLGGAAAIGVISFLIVLTLTTPVLKKWYSLD